MPTLQLPKTRRYSRFAYGDDGDRGRRNVLAVSFVAVDLLRPLNANTSGLMSGQSVSNTSSTTFQVAPNPDVPRNITVSLGSNAAAVPAGNIVVTGTNIEGAVITENFAMTAGVLNTIAGNKAFRTVTSVLIPQFLATGASASVGYGNKFGINMRNLPSMPIKLLVKQAGAAGAESMEDPSASNLSATDVSLNTVTPSSSIDGAKNFRVYLLNYKWAANPTNGQPDYGL